MPRNEDGLTPYRILRWICILCAIVLTYVTWKYFPIPSHPWKAVGWFVFFATLTELLAVNLADDSQVEVTPSSPILWAAACVLGPLLAIVVCTIVSLCADLVCFFAYALLRWRHARIGCADDDGGHVGAEDGTLQRMLGKIARMWESKAGMGAFRLFVSSINYASVLGLMVGLSAVFYSALGGKFLVHGMPEQAFRHFVFPFFGLATMAILVDFALYSMAVVTLDPIPGGKGLYATLLRLHILLIGTMKPLMRAQAFLVVVSLMLSYLYVRLGPWGFVLTGLPMLALRDFYCQWVDEQSAYLDTVTTLATYMQLYHPYTRGHLKRVADMSERLARELRLPADSVRRISHAGLLHDIGKIGVSEEILDKTEKLELEEWEKIKSHPTAGAEIIGHLDFLEGIVDWIRYHHKWHDGRGYPDTTDKDMIPIEASIIAVADSFDAMTDDRDMVAEWVCDSCLYKPGDLSRPAVCPKCGAPKDRVYRKPKTLDQAIDELRRGSGTQFHPVVVKAFLAMVGRDGVHLHVG